MPMADKMQEFFDLYGIPDFLTPWIDRFFTDIEIDLALSLAAQPQSAVQIKQTFSGRYKSDPADQDSGLAQRAYAKGIINLRDDLRYEPADFHARFDKWALFEGWKDIPAEIQEQLNAWELAHYERKHTGQISRLKNREPRDQSLIQPEYALLFEAEALIDLAGRVFLMPCNCRSMMKNCSQDVYTCLRFENDRGLGWEISKSRAKQIMRLANKKGLMQSAELGISADGGIKGAICNCCPDCCFPHLLAEASSAQKLWPLSRYVARHLEQPCNACGLCAKRCPFQAFTSEKTSGSSGKQKAVRFHEELCRGCGVCATACPKQAIEMIPLDCKQSLMNQVLA